MKKLIISCAMLLTAVAGMAQTTTDANGVTTTTDPSKAATVERQVKELKTSGHKAAESSRAHAHAARKHRNRGHKSDATM